MPRAPWAIDCADHAKGDGSSAWPSLETIARESLLSERQVRRCLRNLEASGEIVETGTSRKGTHIYSFQNYRGDNMTPRGGTNRTEGGDMMTPEPSLKQPSVVLMDRPQNGTKKRNEVWDALAYVFGEPTVPTAIKLRGQVCRDLAAAGATKDQVVARASAWPAHFDEATLTDTALRKHWDTLGRKPLRRAR